jgi:hypothetical protein
VRGESHKLGLRVTHLLLRGLMMGCGVAGIVVMVIGGLQTDDFFLIFSPVCMTYISLTQTVRNHDYNCRVQNSDSDELLRVPEGTHRKGYLSHIVNI